MSRRHDNHKTDRTTPLGLMIPPDRPRPPRLVVVSGLMLGFQLELGPAEIVIGRGNDCAVSLPHPSVSRRHCRVWLEGSAYRIEDLGSTNHTYVNGKIIASAELRDGDQIGIGNNAIKFFVGVSMEARYHHELIDLAICDSLTGFYNRRHFRALLDEEVEKVRSGRICLLMLDLDHFKSFNDDHGHMVGDQVLGVVAQVLREHAPAGTPVGRLGGEEFAMLLRGPSLTEAAALAEVLRVAVAAQPIHVGERELPVTVSIGVAEFAPGMDSAALLHAADEQLYRAKQAGRNRVAVTA